MGKISGTSISSVTTPAVLSTGTSYNQSLVFDPDSGLVALVYPTSASSSGAVKLLSPYTPNLTADNYIGISDSAYADTATATIQVVGATDDAQSGLTTGSKHYVQNGGTLSTTPDSPSVYAGIALSATKLLIKG